MIFTQKPPSSCSLGENDIHLWLLKVKDALLSSKDLAGLLSVAEKTRLADFTSQEPAQSFLGSRGCLRLLLGLYTGSHPGKIRLSTEKNGKPCLGSEAGIKEISFNLSHSGSYSLFAFSRTKSIGVDIEKMKMRKDMESLIRYSFPALIQEELLSLPVKKRQEHFYRLWSRQEALAKATGLGIGALSAKSQPDISLSSPWMVSYQGQQWVINDIEIDHEYAAAVCREGTVDTIQGFYLNRDFFEQAFNNL
jgi:4'-phosphopantetheinyl transferase